MIVSNTTPISNLLHVDKIFLLAELFGAVYIPKAVANELNVAFSDCVEWRESHGEFHKIAQKDGIFLQIQQIMLILSGKIYEFYNEER